MTGDSDPGPRASRRAASRTRHGIFYMLLASLFFSLMNVCVYSAKLADPDVNSTTVSFIRVAVNLVLLLVPAWVHGNGRRLFGDFRPALWLRGLFGASALMLSFAAIQRIGVGESAFLQSSSAVFVALLSPIFLGQRAQRLVWIAIGISFLGQGLLFHDPIKHSDLTGRGMAVASGFLAALAYLMVARSGRSNAPGTIVFYFCLVGVVLHLAYFLVMGASWPAIGETWLWALASGFMAAVAQIYMTRAYQQAPAALLGAVGYTGPVLNLLWSVALFGEIPDLAALVGCALILAGGIVLPFLIAPRPPIVDGRGEILRHSDP